MAPEDAEDSDRAGRFAINAKQQAHWQQEQPWAMAPCLTNAATAPTTTVPAMARHTMTQSTSSATIVIVTNHGPVAWGSRALPELEEYRACEPQSTLIDTGTQLSSKPDVRCKSRSLHTGVVEQLGWITCARHG